MASYRTELACRLPPDEAASVAAGGLVALGYVVSSTARGRVHLRFEGGFDGRHDANQPHMVTVAATGRTLVFAFDAPSDGFFGDTPFSALGRRELESRARRAASHAQQPMHPPPVPQHQPPPPPPPPASPEPRVVHHVVERQVLVTRCKFCGHITPVDLAVCSGCGGAKFC